VKSQRQQQVISNDTNVIADYLRAMQVENNSSVNYTRLNKSILTKLSQFHHNNKPFSIMKRNDLVSFFNSFRKSDKEDPMHKWIGSYNTYLIGITRFFKWLENPDLEPNQRPKPQRLQNIPRFKRKEILLYKPSDLWTLEDDLLFLKWCPKERDRCYHAISRDMSARPLEILNLKIKDIVTKNINNKQYAEILVNGKTGSRHLPLIDSLPYIKQWLDHHPHRNNREAYFICSLNHKTFAQQLKLRGLQFMYANYKDSYFPKLLQNPTVSKEDK
jgi:integrase/recombinase XerD